MMARIMYRTVAWRVCHHTTYALHCRPVQGATVARAPVTARATLGSLAPDDLDLRRIEMTRLKRKYGLSGGGAEDADGDRYTDRAARRRALHNGKERDRDTGSAVPVHADVTRPIGADNKGRRMLEHMGYAGGGPDPVLAVVRPTGAGLGYS
jgi:hypothetical protein